jgi:hypothetical protein
MYFWAMQKICRPVVAVAALNAGIPSQIPATTGPNIDNFYRCCCTSSPARGQKNIKLSGS